MSKDIIIAQANEKASNYYELRMTLRSIAQNLTGYRDIYLIGEKPSWVQGIVHIPAKDIFQRKQLSIYRKFLIAAQTESVSDNFIRWDDDVYLLQPFNTSEIKDWHDGTLKDWTQKNINLMYRNVIKNTMKLFPDGLYYDIHAPRIFNKEKYRELEKYKWITTELLTKSTYFNGIDANPVQMRDPKSETGIFHSTNGKLKPSDLRIIERFEKPCKYEADNIANSKTASSLAETAR
jgi:hypothetical protein